MKRLERLKATDALAIAFVQAIRGGELSKLQRLLDEHPGIAAVRIADDCCGEARSLLHVATDYPGRHPNCAAPVRMLVAAGADVNAQFEGPHAETPLHWAASSDDVDVLDALLDAGAEIDVPGAVIGGGTPLTDAVAFAQWKTARRLVARGARASFAEVAALGMLDRVAERFCEALPTRDEINLAFWYACHGGQLQTAEFLLSKGADPNWLPTWENVTPLDAARRNSFPELVEWLQGQGARSVH